MKLQTQYLNSLAVNVYVRWVAPKSGTCRINCLSRVSWPSGGTSLILDVKTAIAGIGPQYPSGFTSLQFTANGICAPFYVNEGEEIWVVVNQKSTTETEIELTPSIA